MAPPARRTVRRQRKTPGSWAAGGPSILMTRVSTSRSGSPRSRGSAARQDVAHVHGVGIPSLRSVVNEDGPAGLPCRPRPSSDVSCRRAGSGARGPQSHPEAVPGPATGLRNASQPRSRHRPGSGQPPCTGTRAGRSSGVPCIDSNVRSPLRRFMSMISFLHSVCLPEVVHDALPGQRMQISEGFNARQVSSCNS